MSDRDFLSRWSRRKVEARKGVPDASAPKTPESAATPTPLPAIESLSADSDFTPFLQKHVEEGVRRAALKTLFNDPRFNVMDGLDVYIDDFSKPDPLPEGWLEQLNQVARLGEYKPPAEELAEKPPETTEAAETAETVDESGAAEPTFQGAERSDTSDGENAKKAVLTSDSSGVNSDEIER
jgi:hypothetical protein